jgi:hypothetical protein
MMLSEVFWVSFVSSCSLLCLKTLEYCYKSKCKEIKLGCLTIIRDTQGEEEFDMNRVNVNSTKV